MEYTRDYVDLARSIKPDEVIIATDFDIEGSLIGYNLVRFALNKAKNIYRMKFSSIVPKELMKAYNNLIEFDYNNAIAGETRHILDWYYGINLSRALMDALKKAGAKNVLSIGRVQGPTLSLVLNREISIINFKPEEYFSIQLKIEDVIFKHPKAFKSKLEAEAYIKQLPDKISIREEKTQEKVVFTPFDLTTLLTETYRIRKISPNETNEDFSEVI
jgi:Topoisomerase IA